MEPLNEQGRDSNAIASNTISRKIKICFAILILVIILLILALLFVIIFIKRKEKIIEIEPDGNQEQSKDWNIYGTIYSNISYSKNGKIINSFKETGKL